MTLDTRLYVLDEVDPQETFRFCRELLGATERHTFTNEPGLISNNPGQGLPAWLMLYHGDGEHLRTAEQADAHDEDCNLIGNPGYVAEWGPCDGNHMYRRACWLTVSFDTAYSYRDDRGYGCGDLHAEYVSKLGKWLDERSVRWEWQNEFTGEIHTGYTRLTDLASGGFEASAWFRTSVLPVIEAEATRGGESR